MKRIERPTYLDELISARGDGNIKVISGLRRCGKSYLLKHIFKDWLIADGVPANHILLYDLENRRNKHLLDPDVLMDTIESKITDDEIYFILIDEVQKVKEFTEVLESLLLIENAEVYVTGSKSAVPMKWILWQVRTASATISSRPGECRTKRRKSKNPALSAA